MILSRNIIGGSRVTEELSKTEDGSIPAALNRIVPEETSVTDETAKKEAAAVASGQYDEREEARSDRLRHHVHLVMVCAIWAAAALVGFAVFSVAWHYLMPPQWEWLTDSQLNKLQTFLFSGFAGAIIGFCGRYLTSRIRLR